MQKTFENGNNRDGRQIMIKIEDGVIEFFFYDQYRRQEEWIKEETERRIENGEEELDEDEKQNYNFYWIGSKEWNISKTQYLERDDNWHNHMREKNWFTTKMEKFLDDNTL